MKKDLKDYREWWQKPVSLLGINKLDREGLRLSNSLVPDMVDKFGTYLSSKREGATLHGMGKKPTHQKKYVKG